MMRKKNLRKPVKTGKRVSLVRPGRDHAEEFVAKSKASRRFHAGLVKPPDSPEKFKRVH